LRPRCFTPDGTRLIAVGVDTLALHVWDLRAIRRGLVPLGLDWDALPYPPANDDVCPPALSIEVARDADAYHRSGLDHARSGRYEQAIEDYSKAITLEPEQWRFWVDRGRVRVRLGQWDKAATDFTQALALKPDDHWPWYQAAPLLLQAGDVEGYHRHRREMLERFGSTQTPGLARRTAKACLLLPVADEELDRAVQLAERAQRGETNDSARPYGEFTMGLAEYRQGDFPAAAQRLGKLVSESGRGHWNLVVEGYLVLAMAQQQQGDPTKARLSLARALLIMQREMPPSAAASGGGWHDYLICQVLRREAELVLGQKPKR
jgi:tetratricopeptide (TPR) repeat protein